MFLPASRQLFKVCGYRGYTPVHFNKSLTTVSKQRWTSEGSGSHGIHSGLFNSYLSYMLLFEWKLYFWTNCLVIWQDEEVSSDRIESYCWSLHWNATRRYNSYSSTRKQLCLRLRLHAHPAPAVPLTHREKNDSVGWKHRQLSSFWMGEKRRWGALKLEPDGSLMRTCLCMNVCMWTWACECVYTNYCYSSVSLDSVSVDEPT